MYRFLVGGLSAAEAGDGSVTILAGPGVAVRLEEAA